MLYLLNFLYNISVDEVLLYVVVFLFFPRGLTSSPRAGISNE